MKSYLTSQIVININLLKGTQKQNNTKKKKESQHNNKKKTLVKRIQKEPIHSFIHSSNKMTQKLTQTGKEQLTNLQTHKLK